MSLKKKKLTKKPFQGRRPGQHLTELVPLRSYKIRDFVYLSFSFCSFSFFSRSALASSSSCFLINCSTSFCLRTLITVFPFSLVSVAISTTNTNTHLCQRQNGLLSLYLHLGLFLTLPYYILYTIYSHFYGNRIPLILWYPDYHFYLRISSSLSNFLSNHLCYPVKPGQKLYWPTSCADQKEQARIFKQYNTIFNELS